jgi:hypothetical protein
MMVRKVNHLVPPPNMSVSHYRKSLLSSGFLCYVLSPTMYDVPLCSLYYILSVNLYFLLRVIFPST